MINFPQSPIAGINAAFDEADNRALNAYTEAKNLKNLLIALFAIAGIILGCSLPEYPVPAYFLIGSGCYAIGRMASKLDTRERERSRKS